jgi:hypothetical protein
MHLQAASLLWQKSHDLVVVFAILIYAIMLIAIFPPKVSGVEVWNRFSQFRLCWGQNLRQVPTKFSNVRFSFRKDISISEPTPSHKLFVVGIINPGLKHCRFWKGYVVLPSKTGHLS